MRHATLVTGNGFTIGLANYLGIGDEYKTAYLLPSDVPLERMPKSNLEPGPLWRRDLFPELWDLWHAQVDVGGDPRSRFFSFCATLADVPAITWQNGRYSYTNRSPSVQLRKFLWFMFVYYDRLFIEAARKIDVARWPWVSAINYLLQRFQLTAISFNYDLVLEHLFWSEKLKVNVPTFNSIGLMKPGSRDGVTSGTAIDVLNANDPQTIVMLKPHGTIAHYSPGGFGGGPDGVTGNNNTLVVTDSKGGPFTMQFRWPPEECPPCPNLVPPGHAHTHFVSIDQDAGPAVAYQFERSEICVICGLSGSAPDDQEIKSYFANLRLGTKVIHFGVGDDAVGPLAKILKELNLNYHYRDVTRLGDLPWLIEPPLSFMNPFCAW